MKKGIVLFGLLLIVSVGFAQKKQSGIDLKNCVVIGQLDNPEDRYSLEINMTEMLSSMKIKTMPSLNFMKMGSDAVLLASDSIQSELKEKGFDTYLIVSVRGYDRRFKVAEKQENFKEALSAGGLYDLYRMDIVSISFEFKFYRNGEYVFGDIVKCGNISDRDTVLKRFRSKVGKRMSKKWFR